MGEQDQFDSSNKKQKKFESDDKSKMIELLRNSVEYQNRNNKIMRGYQEITNGIPEQVNITVLSFNDVMKCLLGQKN